MGEAVENRAPTPTSGWKTKKVILSSILIASLAVVFDRFFVTPVFLKPSNRGGIVDGSGYEDGAVDEEVMSLFVTYDENLDGAIDLAEFVKVANRILHRKKPARSPEDQPADSAPDWDTSGEQFTLTSSFTPLVLTTMTKYSEALFVVNEQPIQGLKSWRNATTPSATFPVNAFGAFLPDPRWSTSLGEPWDIVESRIGKFGPSLTNSRYYPPPVKGKLAILFQLLAMFHPRPFLLTRFGPQGTIACIRAESNDYLDIVFRMHAEFQLNEPPLLPFWFTPGQFLGNIVIRKDGHHIHSFHMEVPTNRSLNVDMEWLMTEPTGQSDEGIADDGNEGSSNMEVDIGYLPQMKLKSAMPSASYDEQTVGEGSVSVEKIKWDKEISFEEAYRALEVKMYGFKEVPYLLFKDAMKKARVENKLVHHILLWGALDDQSC